MNKTLDKRRNSAVQTYNSSFTSLIIPCHFFAKNPLIMSWVFSMRFDKWDPAPSVCWDFPLPHKLWINRTFQSALEMTLHPLVLITNGKRLCSSIKQFSPDLSEAMQSCNAWACICFVNSLIVMTKGEHEAAASSSLCPHKLPCSGYICQRKWPNRLDVSRQINSTCSQGIIITLNTSGTNAQTTDRL